jgi:hypothetical protein
MDKSLRLRYSLCIVLGGLAGGYTVVPGAELIARAQSAAVVGWKDGGAGLVQNWPVLQFDIGAEPVEFSVVAVEDARTTDVTVLIQPGGRQQLLLLDQLDPQQRFRLFVAGQPVRWFEVTGHRLIARSEWAERGVRNDSLTLECRPCDRAVLPAGPVYEISARQIDPLGRDRHGLVTAAVLAR